MRVGLLPVITKQIGGLSIVHIFDEIARQDKRYSPEERQALLWSPEKEKGLYTVNPLI